MASLRTGFGTSFVLLDDCSATEENPSSRLYTDWSHQRVCHALAEWDDVCSEVEADLQAGLHAVILADYEWGACAQLERTSDDLQRAAPCAEVTLVRQAEGGKVVNCSTQAPASSTPNKAGIQEVPAFRFLMFRHCARLSQAGVEAWLVAQDKEATRDKTKLPSAAGVVDVRETVSSSDFEQVFSELQAALHAGEVYQINYTYRLKFAAFGAPLALYRRLRARQPVPYGALIALPDERWVISCSPELFLHHQAGSLTARPMKGTAARVPDAAADACAAAELSESIKNRAENLMIVDLLRNDLSRVAQIGSVRVPALFSVTPYLTVWQMTSTVEAQLARDISFAQIMRALFPCGSITGAPKHRAMQYIDVLENTPRGLYTGAIGWFEPSLTSGQRCGDFCLSVAIRTLALDKPRADGLRTGQLGIGAGIVVDSTAASEAAECALKAEFLTEMDPGFGLIETMYASREAGIRHLRRHWRRLRRTARRFGFAWQVHQLCVKLQAQLTTLLPGLPYRLRLQMDKAGTVQITATQLMQRLREPVNLLLAPNEGLPPMQADDLWLHHKTTMRATYTYGLRLAEERGAFDVLFTNTRGELTEGARSNLLVKLAGRWWTPPLSSGVLPGVMRSALLDDANWGIAERVLTPADLRNAEEIIVCNAVHGTLKAKLVE